MKKESKKKRIVSFGSVKGSKGNRVHLTYNGYNIYEVIELQLKKGLVPNLNKEWDDIVNHYILPYLYNIDKTQCIQKHLKETYENEGYDVEYDKKQIDKEVDELWSRYIQLGKKSLPNNS